MKTIDISQIELTFIQHTNLKTGQLYQLDHFPGNFGYSKDLRSLKNHKPLKMKKKNQFFFSETKNLKAKILFRKN